MKTLQMISFIFIPISICACTARASEPNSLAGYFSAKVAKVDQVVNRWSAPATIFVFQDMNIDIAPEVTFGVNSVLSISVLPEIDFVLTPPASE